jgi:hypothetical protein
MGDLWGKEAGVCSGTVTFRVRMRNVLELRRRFPSLYTAASDEDGILHWVAGAFGMALHSVTL